jgi:hypothetical protein
VLDRRSVRLRAALAAAGLLLAAGVAGLAGPERVAAVRPAVASPVPADLPDSLEFEVYYAGIGREGVDLVWRGLVRGGGGAAGQVIVRMEYAGPPAERRMPIWPVNAWLFFSADDYRSSFAAELSGSMNWRTGDMRVTGLVSDGVRIGTPMEQRMRVEQPGLAGRVMVRFFSRLALLSP